jgi:dipeptidyl aminopeptidase/acylaminoacyl peptidase/CubicO group peptidase (beta-lactamase class C family)
MRRTAILLLLLVCALPGTTQTRYPLRQYLSIRGAGGPTLSPDGAEVAYLTSVTGTAQVWKAPSRSGWPDQLTFFSSGVSSVTWSPTRKEMIVVADDNGNEQFQLTLVNADGSVVTPLTSDPKVRNSFGGWSKDGKTLYYASNARDPRYFDCYLMDVAAKRARRVFQKDAVLDAAALSPDGKTLAAVEIVSNVNNDLYLVDTATGKGRMVTPHEGDAQYNVIGFSDDGKALYLVSDQGRDFLNLAEIDVATGKMTFLMDEKADVGNARLSPDAHLLAYTVNRDGYEELTLWDTRARKTRRLPALPRGIVTPGNFSADGRRLVLSLNAPTYNADAWLVDIPAARAQQVTYSSRAGIPRETFVEPELIRYRTFDGRDIPAFLYLPKEAKPDKSLPVILSVHGGPEAQERPFFSGLTQYFVSRGYAVLSPNIRGSSGYGKAYLAMDNGPKRWDALKDLAAAVDWIGTQPALDAKKVIVWGGSYGGFAVLAMLTHYPDRFAAGVDMFGIADFKTFLANTAPFRRPLRIAEYGDPEKDSEFLDAISPARHVDRIAAPLMVIQGVNDPRVPESESRQIVEKVRAKGGVVEYVLFPDEGHGIAKLPNRIRAFEAMVAFLDKYVRKETENNASNRTVQPAGGTPMTQTKPLPRSAAAAQGVAAAGIQSFLDAVEKDGLALHSLMLLRHGKVVAEGWWSPYAPETPHALFSLTKSFTSTGVGLAVAEGKLSVNDPVLSFFPEQAPAAPDANLKAMRVRDLLTMSTGHDKDATGAIRGQEDWAKAILALPVEHAPGTHFAYNSAASYLLSAIVHRVTGMDLRDYLEPRLFAPLGITPGLWEKCPRGIRIGGWGLSVTTDAIARFGQLYLQKGMWEGKRLLPEAWIAEATSRQVSNGDPAKPSDWTQGYGYQFWRCRNGAYRGDGAFGQYCIVLPEQDAVVAITSGVGDMQAVLNLVWEHLLPAMRAASPSGESAAQEALTQRLKSLTLAGPQGQFGSPLLSRVSGRTYAVEPNELNVESVSFDFRDDGCLLTTRDDKGEHQVACGGGTWKKGTTTLMGDKEPQPVAANGIWTSDDTYVTTLCFTESPFRLTMTCHFAEDRLTLDSKLNVGFGPTTRPQLVGRFAGTP